MIDGLENEVSRVDQYLENYLNHLEVSEEAVERLKEAVSYSVFGGGKRFRPLLVLLTGKALNCDKEILLPWAAALEFVHTYSLVHDDLPLMDDDSERRGRPTNHKVFGEATALLAGDALLTEAFSVVAENYTKDPELCRCLTALLARASGIRGMIGGQAIDLSTKQASEHQLRVLHERKTGALIGAAVEGAAFIAGASEKQRENLSRYGLNLGLAFQVADDVLDTGTEDEPNFTALFGHDGAKAYLAGLTESAVEALEDFGEQAQSLRDMAHFNRNRDR